MKVFRELNRQRKVSRQTNPEQFGAPSEREREREREREDQRSHVSAWDKLHKRACACDFIHLASYRPV